MPVPPPSPPDSCAGAAAAIAEAAAKKKEIQNAFVAGSQKLESRLSEVGYKLNTALSSSNTAAISGLQLELDSIAGEMRTFVANHKRMRDEFRTIAMNIPPRCLDGTPSSGIEDLGVMDLRIAGFEDRLKGEFAKLGNTLTSLTSSNRPTPEQMTNAATDLDTCLQGIQADACSSGNSRIESAMRYCEQAVSAAERLTSDPALQSSTICVPGGNEPGTRGGCIEVPELQKLNSLRDAISLTQERIDACRRTVSDELQEYACNVGGVVGETFPSTNKFPQTFGEAARWVAFIPEEFFYVTLTQPFTPISSTPSANQVCETAFTVMGASRNPFFIPANCRDKALITACLLMMSSPPTLKVRVCVVNGHAWTETAVPGAGPIQIVDSWRQGCMIYAPDAKPAGYQASPDGSDRPPSDIGCTAWMQSSDLTK